MSKEEVLHATEEQLGRIRGSFERSEKEMAEDVADVKKWLEKQPHLPDDEGKIS